MAEAEQPLNAPAPHRAAQGLPQKPSTLVTRRLLPRDPVLVWTWTCLLAMCAGLAVYLRAAIEFFGVPDPGDGCGALGSDTDFEQLDVHPFPPSARCVFRSSPSFDLVPSWVTPVLIACMATAVIAGATAAWCAVRNRNRNRQRSVSNDA